VEKRQDADERIGGLQAQPLVERLDVRPDVVMGKHHALRVPGGAGGEDDRHHLVGVNLGQPELPFQDRHGHEPGLQERCQLVGPRDLVFEVLEIHEVGVGLEVLEAFHGPAAGQDAADPGAGDANIEDLRRDRVVQIDRHAPGKQ